MKEKHDKYREILVLRHLLQEKKIPHKIISAIDGYQIVYPDFWPKPIYSVIEHKFSYGSKEDLLEIKGPDREIHGWMCAADVLSIIEEHYKSNM